MNGIMSKPRVQACCWPFKLHLSSCVAYAGVKINRPKLYDLYREKAVEAKKITLYKLSTTQNRFSGSELDIFLLQHNLIENSHLVTLWSY